MKVVVVLSLLAAASAAVTGRSVSRNMHSKGMISRSIFVRSPEGGGHGSGHGSGDGGDGGGRGSGGSRGGGDHGSYGGGSSSADECEDGDVGCDPDRDDCREECGPGWFCQTDHDDDDEGVCTAPATSGASRSHHRFWHDWKARDLEVDAEA